MKTEKKKKKREEIKMREISYQSYEARGNNGYEDLGFLRETN